MSRVFQVFWRWSTIDERISVRGRLFLLLATLGTPFILYLLASSWLQAGAAREAARQEMVGVARVSAARLDDHVGDIRQLLTIIAQVIDPSVASLSANNALLRSIASTLPAQTIDVSLWTAEGQNVGYLGRDYSGSLVNVANRPFFREVMAGRELTVEAPVPSTTTGEYLATFAVSIERDGRTVGVVSASAQLNDLTQLLEPEKQLPQGAVVTIIDTHRIVIARSLDPQHWIGKTLPALTSSLPQSDAREGRNADGVERIGGFSASRKTPWRVYVGVPKEVALLPVRQQLIESSVVGALLLGLGLVAAMVVGRRIALPLKQLGVDAGILAAGDLKHRSGVCQGGEIGQLSVALNKMATELEERSAALQASRTQLREITDNLPVLISYIDAEQRFRFANSAYSTWLGLDPEVLHGRTLAEVYGAETYALIRHHVVCALDGRRTVYERDITAVQGVRRVEVTLIPHLENNKKVIGLFVLIQDVTENRAMAAAQKCSEERLALALEGAGTALFDWDIVDDRLYQSAQLATMRGAPAQAEFASIDMLSRSIHPEERQGVMERLVAAMDPTNHCQFDAEFRVSTADGNWVWLRSRGRVVERDAAGQATRMTGTYTEITLRKIAEGKLRLLAEFDSLTGLPNRALFHDRLEQALLRHARSESSCALLFLDIDHFKLVNDSLGHAAGDVLLTTFAQTLKSCVRACDTVARLGGDEFTIILEDIKGVANVERICTSILDRTCQRMPTASGEIQVSTSIGVAF